MYDGGSVEVSTLFVVILTTNYITVFQKQIVRHLISPYIYLYEKAVFSLYLLIFVMQLVVGMDNVDYSFFRLLFLQAHA